jgi:large subunit ribosomal protein L19
MNPKIREFERQYLKSEVPDFRPGDTIRVAVRIVEGDKERIQNYEGVCIARHGRGLDETFMVRRVSFGMGMERVFPLHSPRVESVKVLRQGRVRRAKLYYLRELSGRKARIPDTRRKRGAKGLMLPVVGKEKAPAPAKVAAEPSPTPEAAAPAQPAADTAEAQSE